MSANLYELLEVSQTAGPDAIESAYRRLSANSSELAAGGDEDATNRLIALREAYKTLSNQELRRKYDDRLAARQAHVDLPDKSPFPFFKVLLLVGVLVFGAVAYSKNQAEQEKARLVREQAAAELRAAELQAAKDREEQLAADREALQQRKAEALERFNRQQDIAYGNRIARDNQQAEARGRYEQERSERERLTAERQRQHENERQLEREKAQLRRMEAENSRYRYN